MVDDTELELEKAAVGGSSLLDRTDNKSDSGDFWSDPSVQSRLAAARVRAGRNVAWAEGHSLVRRSTGEVVGTIDIFSRSWYSLSGRRNVGRSITSRLTKGHARGVGGVVERPKFLTLTFRDVSDSWLQSGALSGFLDAVRHYVKRHGGHFECFWCAEVQSRGALHYHLLLFGVPFLSRSLVSSWWTWGFFDLRAVDDVGRGVKYLLKYLWKSVRDDKGVEMMTDSEFAFSAFHKRHYGFSKGFQSEPAERGPAWLRDWVTSLGMGEIKWVKRREGGGWSVCVEGDLGVGIVQVPSDFEIVALAKPDSAAGGARATGSGSLSY